MTVPFAVAANAPAAQAANHVPCTRTGGHLVAAASVLTGTKEAIATVFYYESTIDDCVWASVATNVNAPGMGAPCQVDSTGCASVSLDIGGVTAARSWTAVGGTKAVTAGYRHNAPAQAWAWASTIDARLAFGTCPVF